MDIFEAIKEGDVAQLKNILNSGVNPNQIRNDGLSPLHLAVLKGKADCLECLLKQLDILDGESNSPLHIAAKVSDIEAVKILLSFGANENIMNVHGKKPIDLAKDPELKALLAEKMLNSATGRTMLQARMEMIQTIEAELPNEISNLKQFTIELLLANQLFQDRCRETIRQLIEEKHIALHKYRLLENAAGIRDNETGVNFLSQLQYLQLENEQQAATIAYLKIQNRMLETSISQQEDYYRKNLNEMSDQHQHEIKVYADRTVELEKGYAEIQKQFSEEILQLWKENSELKTKSITKQGSSLPATDIQFLQSVQNENNILQLKVKELTAEKMSLSEKLKTIEQLKTISDSEVNKTRSDLTVMKKNMQEAMTKVLTEARTEADERDETSGQIVFVRGENGSKQIKGATPEKLVERLTDPSTFDSQFQASFLLTFRSFMDTQTFLSLLVKRFKDNMIESSPTLTGIQSAQSPIQLRVCNTIKNWIENYWFDFQDEKILLDKLNEFIEFVKKHNEKLSKTMGISFSRKMAGRDDVLVEKKNSSQPKPKPIVPKVLAKRVGSNVNQTTSLSNTINSSNSVSEMENKSNLSLNAPRANDRPGSISNWGGFNFGKLRINEDRVDELKLKLADLDPLEIARQLTLIEYELYTAIRPTEFLDQAWMKEDKEVRAPNICNMTKWSNHVTRWVISEIVSVKDNIKSRAATMERMIMIAQHLEKLNNFNGVKEILAGLQSSSVYRLKKTKEAIGSKYLKIFDDLVKLTSSDLNFKNLRAKIHAADPPLIPFPGVYQGDLVFLDTCSRSKLENGLVNYLKFQKIASYILELQVYQQTTYNLELVGEIGAYIKNFTVLTDDESYNDSLICEPRGS